MPEPAPQAAGPRSESVRQRHLWAFFDSSYIAVNLSKARLEINPDRNDPSNVWVGTVFDEQVGFELRACADT